MFAPDNTVIATIMLLGTMTCWGSWSSIRMLCKADGPVFVMLYILGQFIMGVTCELSLGMATGVPNIFDNQTFVGGWMKSMSWYRILAIVIGGSCCANSDFLASCACTRLPFAVVVPVFMGWALIQATVLNYIIEKSDANPYFLFSGVFVAFLAICCMSLSDMYATNALSEFSSRLSNRSVSLDENSYHEQGKSLLQAHDNDTFVTRTIPEVETRSINSWILVSLFAGVIAGLWAPLQVMGREGTGAVDNPLVCLFLFHCGEVLSVPLMLFYHGRVIVTAGGKSHGSGENEMEMEFISDYIRQLVDLPAIDKFYGVMAGGTVAFGSFLFFIASSVLSSTISFAICSCAPLVSIAIGVVVFKQLAQASFLQSAFIALASFLFIIAITLMVLADL